MTYARVVCDSISSTNDRLTTFEVRFHRFVLAEVNTHRAFCLAGDTRLEFDLPGGSRGRRRVFRMSIAEFVDKWHHGAAPRRSKPRADGSRGENRQPIRSRLASMHIRQLNEVTGLIQTSTVINATVSGVKAVYEVRAGQHVIAGSLDHRIYTPLGWRTIGDLQPGDEIVVCRFGKRDEDVLDASRLTKIGGVWRSQWQRQKRAEMLELYGGCTKCGSTEHLHVHHLVPVHVDPSRAFMDENVTLLCESCHQLQHSIQGWQGGTYLYGDPVVVNAVVFRGEEMTYDLEVAGEFPNFVANGVVVHNSRNSASSRAIPFRKQAAMVEQDLAMPVSWPREQKGMQGGEELDYEELEACQIDWRVAAMNAVEIATVLSQDVGLHKSVVNRLLEPFMWHTAVVSATDWQGFWDQRCSPLAQPEIRVAAEAMRAAYDASEPALVYEGQWHLPYVDAQTWEEAGLDVSVAGQVSVARCARVSYLTQAGTRDIAEDLLLYRRLISADPAHWSPLEHVATPDATNLHQVFVKGVDFAGNAYEHNFDRPAYGNFRGWRQHRVEMEPGLSWAKGQ